MWRFKIEANAPFFKPILNCRKVALSAKLFCVLDHSRAGLIDVHLNL